MDSKYHIILFKNNKKKKKLKSFVRENLANEYYKKLISKSNEIIFDKKFENGYECQFFIGIVSDKYVPNNIHYLDEFGRNKSIDPKIDDENYIPVVGQHYNFSIGIMFYLGPNLWHEDWY